ncbi:MAG: hypothetical protein AB1898_22835 [Acidobacteriota bacterium]
MKWNHPFPAQRSLPRTTRRSPRSDGRKFALAAVLLLGSVLLCSSSAAQSLPEAVQHHLRYHEARVAAFRQFLDEGKKQRELEKVRLPGYNSQLTQILVDFQKHIADMHHRHVNCKSCNSYAKQIKQLAKKIERALK